MTAGVFAAEPAWRCACCDVLTHIRCFCSAHPQLKTVAVKFEEKLKSAGTNGAAVAAAAAAAAAKGREFVRRGSGIFTKEHVVVGVHFDSPTAAGHQYSEDFFRNGGSSPPQLLQAPLHHHHLHVGSSSHRAEEKTAEEEPSSSSSQFLGSAQQPQLNDGFEFSFNTMANSGGRGGGGGDNIQEVKNRGNSIEYSREEMAVESVDRLDACSLGPLRRFVLPSSCVRKVQAEGENADAANGGGDGDAVEGSSREVVAAAAAVNGGGDGGGGVEKKRKSSFDKLSRGKEYVSTPSTVLTTTRKQQQGVVNKKRSWWRQLLKPPQLQWNEYKLSMLPLNCRPIVVFVNVKSGPQVGEGFYRRFLRILHPLQVVCLPRDSPEPALRLFAFLPGVKILSVGGDGTAGWIMSCLDALVEERRQESGGAVEWMPPPVALLPLGTGNDLARCLGWGAGYGSWRQEGAAGALDAVSQASIALLDRWNLTFYESAENEEKEDEKVVVKPKGGVVSGFNVVHGEKVGVEEEEEEDICREKLKEESPPPPPSASSSFTLGMLSPRVLTSTLGSTLGGGGSSGNSTTTSTDTDTTIRKSSTSSAKPLPPPKRKAMNNYLGIGVDAKVALEFHEMRESYPQWFQSQFGNKLVYTGVGALDIVSGGQLNLPEKLVIECDGQIVPLPLGAEGILIVNIPSYMGGVDLWASGAGAGSVQGHQSMCDGRVEIVAVGGSWHLGQLTVGLSRAVRLRQGRRVVVRTKEAVPMQVDGEPFLQPAGKVVVELRGQSRVLRRVESKPVAKVMRAVEDVLEAAAEKGVITSLQHDALGRELASKLHSQL